MSLYYRTLLSIDDCKEWVAQSGSAGVNFLQIQWQDCDGITQGLTLFSMDPLYTFCVKGGTTPIIVSFNGGYTLTATGNIC